MCSLPFSLCYRFSFDPLDVTKVWPEDVFPLQPVGRMVLNRNPDNFFNENEQLAFCPALVVPGGWLVLWWGGGWLVGFWVHLVCNRKTGNFFNANEQLALCPALVVLCGWYVLA